MAGRANVDEGTLLGPRLLIGQIPCHCEISIEPADGNNLSICLDQQTGERLVAGHRAADTKRVDDAKSGIHLAVAIEPYQAAENRRVSVDEPTNHDLPIRLESDSLSHRGSLLQVERLDIATEGCIHLACFEETRRTESRAKLTCAVRVKRAIRDGHNIVAIWLENSRGLEHDIGNCAL